MPVIGYDPDFAPLSFTGASGEAEGRAIALLRAAGARAGVACSFVPLALGEQEASLAAGKIDAIAVMAATPERCERFTLSDPYLTTGAAWFALAPFEPSSAPAQVVTPAAGPLLAVIAERWPHLAVVPVSGYREALGEVAEGRAAAAALNADAGRHMCTALHPGIFALPERPFLEIPLALACRKGRQSVELSALIAALRRPDPRPST